MGICIDVELGCGGAVAAGGGAAHDQDSLEVLRQIRVQQQRHGCVGHGAGGDELQLALLRRCAAVDGLPGRKVRSGTVLRQGQLDAAQAVFTVKAIGWGIGHCKRLRGPGIDGIGPAHQPADAQGIAEGFVPLHVACHRRQARKLQLRQGGGAQNGRSVVGAGITVEPDTAWFHVAPP